MKHIISIIYFILKIPQFFSYFFFNWSTVLVYLEMHRRVEQKKQTQSNHWGKKRFFIRERESRERERIVKLICIWPVKGQVP